MPSDQPAIPTLSRQPVPLAAALRRQLQSLVVILVSPHASESVTRKPNRSARSPQTSASYSSPSRM